MTFLRNEHRPRWCRICKDITPHDEAGNGLCMHCVWDVEDWLRDQALDQATRFNQQITTEGK